MSQPITAAADVRRQERLLSPVWTQADVEQLVPDRFEQMVRKYGDRLAVKSGDVALTYDALNHAANRLAHAILCAQSGNARSIALLFEHGTAMVVAILGVLKAGHIFVPLAPTNPEERLRVMMADSEAVMLITNHKNLALAQAVVPTSVDVLNLDELDQGLSNDNPDRSSIEARDARLSIIYTSGSTGTPKGAIQAHLNVLHEVRCNTNVTHITPEDRVALLSSYTIHAAMSMTCHALMNGAALLPFDVKGEGVQALSRWLVQEKITVYHSVTTVFRHLMASLGPEQQFPSMRSLQLGGEPVSKRDVILFRQHFPSDCLFRVGLGSTEAGLATYDLIGPETELPETDLPLGYASAGRQILILDEDGNTVADGHTGEIAIKSRYLFHGYWKNPEQTEAAFLPLADGSDERIFLTGDLGRIRTDGKLEHLGRKDFQVKIRGNRVETHEIETRLRNIDSIREAAVAAKKDHNGEQRLVAYIVPAGASAPTPATLREALGRVLPQYMIPAAFVVMQQIPQLTFGKIDRLALPTPDWDAIAAESGYVAPRTPLEEAVAQLWAEVLGVRQVSIHAHFFDLGGDSLRAAQVIGRIGSSYQVELPVNALFEAPTVAEQALIVAQRLAENSEDDSIAQLVTELEGLGEDEPSAQLASDSV